MRVTTSVASTHSALRAALRFELEANDIEANGRLSEEAAKTLRAGVERGHQERVEWAVLPMLTLDALTAGLTRR